MIGEVLQKASSWFRENLPQKSPNSSAEEVSAHDVDEGMETENMGFTSSIALQYVSQAQVGLTCDLAWNPKHKCLKFTITNNPGRGGTIHQREDRDRQGGWEKGGWFKDVVRFPTDINLDRFPASLACGSGFQEQVGWGPRIGRAVLTKIWNKSAKSYYRSESGPNFRSSWFCCFWN